MSDENRKYMETHEWGLLAGNIVTVGLSEFAVKHLSDLVFIQLPEAGDKVERGESFGEIESVKAVSDLNAPVTGEVVEVNEAVAENLELISTDPTGEGWVIKIKIDDQTEFQELLSSDEYTKQIEEEEDEEDDGTTDDGEDD